MRRLLTSVLARVERLCRAARRRIEQRPRRLHDEHEFGIEAPPRNVVHLPRNHR
jgi:hypothetical protein